LEAAKIKHGKRGGRDVDGDGDQQMLDRAECKKR
jgi:hypothetical protein